MSMINQIKYGTDAGLGEIERRSPDRNTLPTPDRLRINRLADDLHAALREMGEMVRRERAYHVWAAQ